MSIKSRIKQKIGKFMQKNAKPVAQEESFESLSFDKQVKKVSDQLSANADFGELKTKITAKHVSPENVLAYSQALAKKRQTFDLTFGEAIPYIVSIMPDNLKQAAKAPAWMDKMFDLTIGNRPSGVAMYDDQDIQSMLFAFFDKRGMGLKPTAKQQERIDNIKEPEYKRKYKERQAAKRAK